MPQDNVLRALVFDSVFDTYRGVVSYVRLMSGSIKRGVQIRMFSTNKTYEVKEVRVFTPKMTARDVLEPGDVGYPHRQHEVEHRSQDRGHRDRRPAPLHRGASGIQGNPSHGLSGIYPVSSEDFEQLKLAMGKLQINDAAFSYQAESSAALGFGFRCGFLGLLHMEIVQERLRREYNMDVISTYPGVVYEITKTNGEEITVDNPCYLPEPQEIQEIREPMVKAFILIPNDYIGEMMQLVMEKRGEVTITETLDDNRVMLTCGLPLNEILVDFNDCLKA
ncbi:MAG: hypothetical protein R3F31_06715 [Verrucomicrobiales bacterium]